MSSPRPRIDWLRLELPPGELERLNERSNFKGFLQTFAHLGLMFLTGWLCVHLWLKESWLWLLVGLYLHGTVMSFTINAVHELVHGTVFRTSWLNRFFADVFGLLGWNNHVGFWASHQQHHLYTLHYPLDQEVVLPDGVKPKAFFKTFFNPRAVYEHIKHTYKSSQGFMGWEWLRDIVGEGEQRQAVHRFARNILIFHGTVFVVSILSGWWILILLLSTHIAYGRSLQFLLNQTQHIGMRSGVNDFRLNCRTFETNFLFRLLYWQMNYHIEHHMYAGVPCYNLRKLHRLIKKDLPHTPQGLLATWYEIFYLVHKEREGSGLKRLDDLETGEPANALGAEMSSSTESKEGEDWKVWQCRVCAFIYDEALGWPDEGIAPGTRWEDVPDDWKCPDCGVSKSDFEMTEISKKVSVSTQVSEPKDDSILIVGGGMAARALVKEIRARQPFRRITLVSEDRALPLNKPSLSTALRQNKKLDELSRETPEEWARRERVNLLTGREVISIDAENRRVILEGGELTYGDLVLATGASPFIPPIEGSARDDIHTVNSPGSYQRFRDELKEGQHVLVIGGGLIGCEMASDLIESGHRVTLIEAGEELLSAFAPKEVGEMLRENLKAKGVDFQLGKTVVSLEQRDDQIEVKLSSDEVLMVDHALVATGLRANTGLARSAGLEVDLGIRVNSSMESSMEHIYALGDCAQWSEKPLPFILPLLDSARVLAEKFSGADSVMPEENYEVVAKVESFPIRIQSPRERGTWTFVRRDEGMIGRCHSESGELVGWILAGKEVQGVNMGNPEAATPVA